MRLAAVLLSCLLVAGCGGDEPEPAPDQDATDAASEAQPAGGPGTYSGTTETGTQITLEVPVDASDPRLAEVEKYRKLADGAPPFTYFVATYDNTEGTADVWVNGGAVVVTEDGQTVLVRHIAMQDGVMETYIIFTHGLPKPVESEANAYYSGFYDRQKVRPGATETVILATDETLPSIGSVAATLNDWGDEIALAKE